MDKSDSRLHCEQIEKLMKAGRYNDAVYLVDKVDWRKEEDIKRLIQAAEAYRRTRRYDDAVNILKMAHNKKPNNKKIVYLLCETYFESKDVVTAQVYLDRYQSMTDRSDWHYDALKYKRALAYDLPVTEKIDILVDLKKKEPAAEQFRYELAKLYNQARQYAECAAECDELVLLFGDDGKYAKKSLELKRSCVPLTEEQELLLRKLSLGINDQETTENTGNVKLMNTMDMSALNLQNSLAKDIQTLKSEDDVPVRRKRPEFNTKSLEQTVPPSTQEVFFSDKTADISFTQYDLPKSSDPDMKEVKPPKKKRNPELEKMGDHLYSDEDGQVSFTDASFDDIEDDNIPGQITMDDLLSDWSKIKEKNTQNLRKSIHEDFVESTGKIFEKKKEVEEEPEEEPGSIWKEVADLEDEFSEMSQESIEAMISEAKSEMPEVEFDEKPAIEPETDEPEFEEINAEEAAQAVGETAETAEATEAAEEIAEEAAEETEEVAEEAAEESDVLEFSEEVVDEEEEIVASPEETVDGATKIIPEIKEEMLASAKEEKAEKAVEETSEEETEKEDSYDEEEDEKETEGVKDLSPEERKLFSQFLHPRSMRTQIANALENISLAAYVGNVLITTDNTESGFALAKSIVKFVKFADVNFSGAMSRIDATDFNVKNIPEILDRLNNGALVITDANKLSNNALIKLTQGINQEERGILIFLVDTRAEIKKLVNRQRTLTDYFNIKIDIIAMSEAALVDYGMKYANNLGYSIDDGFANMAFHKRVREAQAGNHSVTIAEVKEIVDEAIEYNKKRRVSNLFRKMSNNLIDENGMIMLREKDFD
ncbi:Tetratricopeptide repeat-containing protein [Lachnospiraceae bacterium G41]|nr:Tetratricopeptide repeat-containing protein [Lachnospiraceae bacterium G41]